MQTGALTSYIDVAQVTLYVFWFFFAGLIFYLRREDKREGYPLGSDRTDNAGVVVQGWPLPPAPKTYILPSGRTVQAPSGVGDTRPIPVESVGGYPGSPFEPTGDPMRDGVGPASYAERHDEPDLTWEGENRIVPLRVATDFGVCEEDPDPRGWPVIGADGETAGSVAELWVDRAEPLIRYYEVALSGGRTVLLPYAFADVQTGRGQIKVEAILASQFAAVPGVARNDRITALEEDRICGYFAGGKVYATPARTEPLL